MSVERCVWIEWVDSTYRSEWTDGVPVVSVIKTIGFVVHETSDYITVSGHWDEGNENYHGPMSIPKVAIRGIWEVTFT